MAIGAPWVGAAVQGNVAGSNILTATVDVSGATNGEVVWIVGALSNAELADLTPPAGWSSFSQMAEGTAAATSTRAIVFWKVKASTDTTVTITDATNWTNSCRVQFVPISWPGVNTTTPAESVAWATHTTLGTSYPTGSGTPTLADRWAVGVFLARGTTANVAWTSDAALTGVRATPSTTATPFFSLLVADSAAAVTQAAHTYTATGQSASHGIGGVFYLIPATTGTIAASPTGIATAEAFGTAVLALSLLISPTAVSSGEAFGTPAASQVLTASPPGIPGAEAFGTAAATAVLTVAPTGVATAEAFGTPTANAVQTCSPAAIPSSEAFGTPAVLASLSAATVGIASGEAFGTAVVTTALVASPAGIASGEQFGTATATASLAASPVAIGTGEAFGTPAVVTTGTLAPVGIPSGQAFGTPTAIATLTASPAGIGTSEAFGTPTAAIATTLAPTGIPTGQAFGVPVATFGLIAAPTAITTGETFGLPTAAVNALPPPVLIITHGPSSSLQPAPVDPALTASHIPSSNLEASHGV